MATSQGGEEYYEEEIIEEEIVPNVKEVIPSSTASIANESFSYITRKADPPMVSHNVSEYDPDGCVVEGVDNTEFVTYPPNWDPKAKAKYLSKAKPDRKSKRKNSSRKVSAMKVGADDDESSEKDGDSDSSEADDEEGGEDTSSGSSHSSDQEELEDEESISNQVGQINIAKSTNTGDPRGAFGPKGRWKHKLCACCDVIMCTPLCCMTYFCNMMVIGQLMTRLGLDWCGNPNPSGAAGTFALVVMLVCAYWAGCVAIFGIVFTPLFLIYYLVISTRTRFETRQHFQIQPEYCRCCTGAMEDCCLQVFCSCCSTIQIARHTHDEEQYPYQFDLPTGLPDYAPSLYEY